MLPPRTIWIDAPDWEHCKRRLVLLESADATIPNDYYIEIKGEQDAMGRYKWNDCPLDMNLFKLILQTATFPPVPIEPPGM